MGTAVLFPQDCLRPRSRHKHQTTEMIDPSECTPMSKRNSPSPAQSQDVGLLPLPGQRGHSSPVNIPRSGSNTKHFRCRRGAEQRDSDYSLRSVSDVPVYQILQLPKQADSAVNEFAQFFKVKARSVMVQEKNATTKKHQNDGADSVDKCNNCAKAALNIRSDGFKHRNRGFDSKPVKVCCKGGSVYESKDASKILNGNQISAAEVYKFPSVKVGAVKARSAPVDKVQVGSNGSVRVSPSRVAPNPFMTKATGKVNDVSCRAVIVQRFEEHHRLLPHLRRMSTEPHISTHISGQSKSKAMHISYEKSKSNSHAHGGGICDNASPLSCEERWAGSAYTCSPSPSSLPLPKLCLPQTRFSSLEIPSLVKQYSTSVYMQPFLGSSAPSQNGGAWDVAFATKSLRKMLNLDPC